MSILRGFGWTVDGSWRRAIGVEGWDALRSLFEDSVRPEGPLAWLLRGSRRANHAFSAPEHERAHARTQAPRKLAVCLCLRSFTTARQSPPPLRVQVQRQIGEKRGPISGSTDIVVRARMSSSSSSSARIIVTCCCCVSQPLTSPNRTNHDASCGQW